MSNNEDLNMREKKIKAVCVCVCVSVCGGEGGSREEVQE